MGTKMKLWLITSVTLSVLKGIQGTNLRLRNAIQSSGELYDADGDKIPGRAGIDYPVYASVPVGTNFRCGRYKYTSYFADVETQCQAYHACFPDGRSASFLCPNGTLFDERYNVCNWWFHSECPYSPVVFDQPSRPQRPQQRPVSQPEVVVPDFFKAKPRKVKPKPG